MCVVFGVIVHEYDMIMVCVCCFVGVVYGVWFVLLYIVGLCVLFCECLVLYVLFHMGVLLVRMLVCVVLFMLWVCVCYLMCCVCCLS